MIVLGKRRLSGQGMIDTFKDAGTTTTVIFIIVIGGILLAPFLTYTALATYISDGLLGIVLSPYPYLAAFARLYLIPVMFVEPTASMVTILPLMVPILVSSGFAPYTMGVIA